MGWMRKQLLSEVRGAVADEHDYAVGANRISEQLIQDLAEGKLKPDDFSPRDLAETLIEDGVEWVRWISEGKSGGAYLSEAGSVVDTSAFSNIMKQIAFSIVQDAYKSPEFLWPKLCKTVPTVFLQGERIPGIGEPGDQTEMRTPEGMPYPEVGLNEIYIDTPATERRGKILPITRDVIVADRTGVLMMRAQSLGKWMGYNKEKRVLDVVTGQTNPYVRNGIASNTYLTSGAYINSQTGNALDTSGNEWRALEKCELLFDAIVDPNTNEPIVVPITTLLVPTALKRSAMRILEATAVQTVDMRANAGTVRTDGRNPYAGASIEVLSSPYVKLRSSSATKWWAGNPMDAFAYMEVWGIETLQAPGNSEAEFTRDVMFRIRVTERGVPTVLEPRQMTQNDQ